LVSYLEVQNKAPLPPLFSALFTWKIENSLMIAHLLIIQQEAYHFTGTRKAQLSD